MNKFGWLMIRRSFKRGWNHRFLKLNGNVLSISVYESLSEIKERILIDDRVKIKVISPTEFSLYLPDGTALHVSGETTDQIIDWLNAFKQSHSKYAEVGRDSFDVVKSIGTGHFSTVYLARMYLTGEYVAVKVSKTKEVSLNEKEIVSSLESPFVIGYKFFFEFNDESYLGLEFSSVGDLFGRLENFEISLRDIKIYAAELIIGLQYIHNHELVFRDLKPENIIVSHDGHLKLTDFGLATSSSKAELNQFCGTPEYAAPEVLNNQPYGKSSDVWSFGIVLYELLFGESPFYCENGHKMIERITAGKVPIPEEATEDQIEIIQATLTRDPQKRPTFEELKKFAFFNLIDWKAIEEKKYETDFLPAIDEEDSSSSESSSIEESDGWVNQ